jgi:hypothetical protein
MPPTINLTAAAWLFIFSSTCGALAFVIALLSQLKPPPTSPFTPLFITLLALFMTLLPLALLFTI